MSSDAETRANMVLRTVYLPPEVDSELRRLAFDWARSKGEIIRECVRIALDSHRTEMFVDSTASDNAVAEATYAAAAAEAADDDAVTEASAA